ncbi:MAG TPA: serine hydrolase [Firmicutes bacterium]|nr:serine hydrolase [Bacillota bacterium]
MRTLRHGTPTEADVHPGQLEKAYEVIHRFVEERRIPGAVIAIGRHGVLIGPRAFGYAAWEPQKVLLSPDAVYDLASVTKVVATTSCALMLLERGVWRLDDNVRLFVPEFAHDDVRIRHLLTHTSGLPAWRALYKRASTPEAMIHALFRTPLEYPTGTKVVYSCLGYILLGLAIERISGLTLHEFTQQELFVPLNMQDTGYLPDPEHCERATPTEVDPRTGLFKQGIVHDENACHLGGISGNAGLFSTAADLAVFCQLYLNLGTYGSARIFSPHTIDLATQNHTAHLNAARGLGWVVKGQDHFSSAGDLFSPQAYGHTGFTGTSLWIDPVRDLFLVLLTNGVHPKRDASHHIRLRPLVANAVAAALLR